MCGYPVNVIRFNIQMSASTRLFENCVGLCTPWYLFYFLHIYLPLHIFSLLFSIYFMIFLIHSTSLQFYYNHTTYGPAYYYYYYYSGSLSLQTFCYYLNENGGGLLRYIHSQYYTNFLPHKNNFWIFWGYYSYYIYSPLF